MHERQGDLRHLCLGSGITTTLGPITFCCAIVGRVDESRPCWPDTRTFHDRLLVLRAREMDGARGFSVVAARNQGLPK